MVWGNVGGISEGRQVRSRSRCRLTTDCHEAFVMQTQRLETRVHGCTIRIRIVSTLCTCSDKTHLTGVPTNLLCEEESGTDSTELCLYVPTADEVSEEFFFERRSVGQALSILWVEVLREELRVQPEETHINRKKRRILSVATHIPKGRRV